MELVTSIERILKRDFKREGKKEAQIEAAREFIKFGVSLDIISKALKLPLEQIQKLATAKS